MGKIDEIGILKRLQTLASVGLPYMAETWQAAAIDATVWTQVLTVGGTIARDITEEPYQKVVLAGPANGDAARLHTVQEWQLAPDTWGANTFNKLLIMEWEAKFDTVASIDNATFFMGLSAIALATRAVVNIAGFILTADALNSITQDATVNETIKAVGAPTITTFHKYGIAAYNRIIEFYVDEVMQARHLTAEYLPDVNAHGQFYLPQEALAAWVGLTLYATGAFVVPTVENGFCYEATTGGTTLVGEPVWPLVPGNTVVDGTVTWTCRTRSRLHVATVSIRPGVIL